MRISALSTRSGVSVATLKYYLREGLLHPGHATAVNQADYDESHVRRVALVRALLVAGQLRVADVQDVIAAVEAQDVSLHEAFGVAQDALVPERDRSDPAHIEAGHAVDRLVKRHHLDVRPDAASKLLLADALALLTEFGFAAVVEDAATLVEYLVEPALDQARFEVAQVPQDATRGERLAYTVIGTVAFEIAAAAVRRLALEHASAERFGADRS